jgi:hypothetical protein
MLRNTLALVAMSLSLMACGVSPEEAESSTEASSANVGTQEQNLCEPGPSSQWCQNVAGKACTATTNRRCYIPNYCEWALCRCTGGTWQCE